LFPEIDLQHPAGGLQLLPEIHTRGSLHFNAVLKAGTGCPPGLQQTANALGAKLKNIENITSHLPIMTPSLRAGYHGLSLKN
jgi:hypothetical protein